MPSFFTFLKNNKNSFIVAAVVLIGGAAIVFALSNNPNGKKYETFSVQPVQLKQFVSATGFLEPTTSVHLAFHTSGEVEKVLVDVGARVKKNDVLASLVNSSQKAILAQNKAVLAEAQAALNLEVANATDEDIAIARSDVAQAVANQGKAQVDYNNAQIDLTNTKKTVAQDIKTAELNLQNAKLNLQKVQSTSSTATTQTGSTVTNASLSLKTTLDQLLVSINNVLQLLDKMYGVKELSYQSFQNYLTDGGTGDFAYAKDLYIKNLASYEKLKQQFDAFSATPTVEQLQNADPTTENLIRDLNENIINSSLLLNKTRQTYTNLSQLRSDLNTAASSFNTNSSSYKTAKQNFDDAVIGQTGSASTTPLDIQSAQLLVDQQTQNLEKARLNGETQISNKETALKSRQAELNIAGAAVTKANAQLEKVLAGPRAVDVAPFKARVQQAQASVQKAQSDYNDTLVTAPFDGVITAKNIDPGEQFLVASGAADNTPALGLIDDSLFHIDVNIPETQVTKISPESHVTVTFDSLGSNTVFEAKILSIEPASNNVQGIIYYKAKVALVKADPNLKAGMTANVSIDSGESEAVLAIPEKAIVSDGSNQKTVMIAPDTTLVVRTGARGDNGLIEVVAGLKAGDTVLIPLN